MHRAMGRWPPSPDLTPRSLREAGLPEWRGGLRPARPSTARTRGHRWRRRLAVAVAVVLALALVVGAAGYGYARWRFSQIHRVRLGALRNETAKEMTVLLVGSDSRAVLAGGESRTFGDARQVSGQRSDVIMLLHVDPTRGKAALLSVPRDLYVPIAGTRGENRINTAFAQGPNQLIQTIRDALGIEVNHYVEVNFDGFRGIVEAVDGLDVYFPAPARDPMSGLRVPAAGCRRLDGSAALAYVRSRHYEYYENGRWRADPTGDLGRIGREQDFIRRMVAKAVSSGKRDPLTANQLVGTAVKNLTIDSGLSEGQILGLGRRFSSLSPTALDTMALPTTPTVVGVADVLRLKQPDASATIDRFLHGPPAPEGPPTAQASAPAPTTTTTAVRSPAQC